MAPLSGATALAEGQAEAGRDAGDVEVVHDYEDLGDVEIDRHKIMEILVNLIKNAHDAMDEDGTEEKSLTLRIRGLAEERVQLEVTDSGPGIAEDDLARIFNHGFTTKKDGHGYGLHVSANRGRRDERVAPRGERRARTRCHLRTGASGQALYPRSGCVM